MTTENQQTGQSIVTRVGDKPSASGIRTTTGGFAEHILHKYFVTPATRHSPPLVLRMLRAGRSAASPKAAKSTKTSLETAALGDMAARLVPTRVRRIAAPRSRRLGAGMMGVSLQASVIAPPLLLQRKPMLCQPGNVRAPVPTPVAPPALEVAFAQLSASRLAHVAVVPSGDRSPSTGRPLAPPLARPAIGVGQPGNSEPTAVRWAGLLDGPEGGVDPGAHSPAGISVNGPAVAPSSRRARVGILNVYRSPSLIAQRGLVQRKPMVRSSGEIHASAPTLVAQPLVAGKATAVIIPSADASPPTSRVFSPQVSSPAILFSRPHPVGPAAARWAGLLDGPEGGVDPGAHSPAGISVNGPAVAPSSRRARVGILNVYRSPSLIVQRGLVQRKPMVRSSGEIHASAPTLVAQPLVAGKATAVIIPSAEACPPTSRVFSPQVSSPAILFSRPHPVGPAAARWAGLLDGPEGGVDPGAHSPAGISVNGPAVAPSSRRARVGILNVYRSPSLIAQRGLVQRKPMVRSSGEIHASAPTLVAQPLVAGKATAVIIPSADASPPTSRVFSPQVSSPAILFSRPHPVGPAAARWAGLLDGPEGGVDPGAHSPAGISVNGPAVAPSSRRARVGILNVYRSPSLIAQRGLVQRKPMVRSSGEIHASAPTLVAQPLVAGKATAVIIPSADASPPTSSTLAAHMTMADAGHPGGSSPPPRTAMSPPVSSRTDFVRHPGNVQPVAARSTSAPDHGDATAYPGAHKAVATGHDSQSAIAGSGYPATDSSRPYRRARLESLATPLLPRDHVAGLSIPALSRVGSARPTPNAAAAGHPGLVRRASVPGLRQWVQRKPLSHHSIGGSAHRAMGQPSALNPRAATPHPGRPARELFGHGSRLALEFGPAQLFVPAGFRHFVHHTLSDSRVSGSVIDPSARIVPLAADRLPVPASRMPKTTLGYGSDGGFVYPRTTTTQWPPAVSPRAHRELTGRPFPAKIVRGPRSDEGVEMSTRTLRLDAPPASPPLASPALTLPKPPTGVTSNPTLVSATLEATAPTVAAQAATRTSDHGPASVVSALSIEALADRIFHILERRLVVERERRGIRP
jgi:hypothetical protein